MKLSNANFSKGCLILIVLFVVLNIVGIEPFRSMVSLVVLFILPGYLLLFLLRANLKETVQRALCAVGLSILVLMVCGLAVNTIGALVPFSAPLALLPMLITLSLVLVLLVIANLYRNRGRSYRVVFPHIKPQEIGMYLVPPLLTLLAVVGSTLLNNFLGNEASLVTLAGIGLVYLLLILFCKKLPNAFVFWSIYWLSLSLLFMTSLRGAFATGHDIQREYYIFELTKSNYLWDMNKYKDAYNACLSITILPTLISDFVTISDVYIYKIIFQMIFAATPLIVYMIARRFVRKRLALACVILFSGFPTFLNDMPFLNRQEIGFYYFGLMVLLMLNSQGQRWLRETLFVLFGIGMVLSHYSTSYITIVMYVLIFGMDRIIALPLIRRLIDRLRFGKVIYFRSFLKWQHLLILIAALAVWNILITNTAGSFSVVIKQTIDDILYSSSGAQSGDVGYSLIHAKKLTDSELAAAYYKAALDSPDRKQSGSAFFPDDLIKQYPIHLVPQEQLALTPFGQLLTTLKINVNAVHTTARALIANAIQLLLVVGILIVFLFKKRSLPLDLYTMTATGIFLCGLMIVLPRVSVEYGLLRMFQQMLFVFSIFIVIGLTWLFSFLRGKREIAVGIVSLGFLLHLSGFIPNLTGGFSPQLNTNNGGLYYDAYFIHASDVAAAQWLRATARPTDTIQSSNFGAFKLQTFGNLFALPEIIPPAIYKNSYIYLDYTNVKKDTIVNSNETIFTVSSSNKFFDDYKDRIYSNGSSIVYK